MSEWDEVENRIKRANVRKPNEERAEIVRFIRERTILAPHSDDTHNIKIITFRDNEGQLLGMQIDLLTQHNFWFDQALASETMLAPFERRLVPYGKSGRAERHSALNSEGRFRDRPLWCVIVRTIDETKHLFNLLGWHII